MSAIAATTANGPAITPTPEKKAPEHSGLSFGDLLDVINPLQHIPVISTIYRRITGDTMSPAAEIAGGALYGGIIGTVASIADVIFAQETGKDFGETVLGWLGFKDKHETQLASTAQKANPTPTPAVPARRMVSSIAPQAAIVPRAIPASSLQARPTGASIPGMSQLMGALEKQGVDPAIAACAAFAYRSTIGWQDEQNANRSALY
jgi:hypothetical protein